MARSTHDNSSFSTNQRRNSHQPDFFYHEFTAWLPDAVLGPKVDDFLATQPTKILRISPDYVRLLVGETKWFAWSNRRQSAIDLRIRFERRHKWDAMTNVVVEMRPTRLGNENSFDARCRAIIRELHKSLLAQNLGTLATDES